MTPDPIVRGTAQTQNKKIPDPNVDIRLLMNWNICRWSMELLKVLSLQVMILPNSLAQCRAEPF